jgi:FAD synthase
LHTFTDDFYGQELRLVVAGYLRPELNFPSLDALKSAIAQDIVFAKESLGSEDRLLALSKSTALAFSG